jgi:hypothetical protein
MRIILLLLACALVSCVPLAPPPPEASGSNDACSSLCGKYLGCKGNDDPNELAGCVATCNPETVDPQQVAALEAMDCPTFVATLEGSGGQSGQPGQPGQPQDGQGQVAGLAGIWVAEESSLDPQFYMSYTQYVTLWPDGSVSYAKDEGGASRTRIDESTIQFRSWREGQQPQAQIVGRWSSDGTSVTVQWSLWNNLRSQGRVRGNDEITLSGMGALEEGATLAFRRQR